jgi:hypothetical protein
LNRKEHAMKKVSLLTGLTSLALILLLPLIANAEIIYDGTIRVYVTEIIGRWEDDNDIPFHNAFLSFALEEEFTLNETETLTWNVQWDGHDYGDIAGALFDNVEEGNIKVIAAVFNADSSIGYSSPPDECPFYIHNVDATAAAICGGTGYNAAYGDFTHTVLVEDFGTSW